eukprot:7379168-Prymnesium_polylepis.1
MMRPGGCRALRAPCDTVCSLRSPSVVECGLSPVPAALVLVPRAVCPRSPSVSDLNFIPNTVL